MNSATQRYALHALLREWPLHTAATAGERFGGDAHWRELATAAVRAEAHRWLAWGSEIGFFPAAPARPERDRTVPATPALPERDRTALDASLAAVARADDYGIDLAKTWSDDAAVDAASASTTLHAFFQQAYRLAATFARQRPAAVMLTTIALEYTTSRFSFYELPQSVGTLTADQVATVLAASDAGNDDDAVERAAANAGALGIAGVLQTLEHLASVIGVLDTLDRVCALQAGDGTQADRTAAEPPPSAEAVRHFKRRFADCQRWRIDLAQPVVRARFDTLTGFAAEFVREALVIDYGRVMQQMVAERTTTRSLDRDADDLSRLEQFDPRAASLEWLAGARSLADDWTQRIAATGSRVQRPDGGSARNG